MFIYRESRTDGEMDTQIGVVVLQRRIKDRRKTDRMIAIALLFLIELVSGLAAGTVAGLLLVPLGYLERGYFSFGGEWFVMYAVSLLGCLAVHRKIFGRKTTNGKRREDGKTVYQVGAGSTR